MYSIQLRARIKNRDQSIPLVGFCYEGSSGIRLWFYKDGHDSPVNESFDKDHVVIQPWIHRCDRNKNPIFVGDTVEYTDTHLCDKRRITGIVSYMTNVCQYTIRTELPEGGVRHAEIGNIFSDDIIDPDLLIINNGTR